MIQEQVSLYFQQGSSDKEYHTQLIKDGKNFVVNFQYGKRGSTLKTGTKTKDAVPLEEATKIYAKLVKSKMAKGYEEGEGKTSFSSSNLTDTKTDSGIFPQLLVELQEDEIDRLINDDDFALQEKKDGERRMLDKSVKETRGINKKGKVVPLPTVIENSLKDEATLDNEIIGDHLYAFDLLSLNGKCLRSTPFFDRIALLDSLKLGKNITVIETAIGTKAKKKLLKKLIKDNAEGLVFKRISHQYQEGRPNSGGDVFKIKFYKTTTCRVANHTKGVRSIGLEMLDGSKVTPVGKATIYPNKEVPAIGSYVEIKYLYAYRGGSLYQPVYLGERTDQDDSDIGLKQLVYKAE